jgi:hypothetical protein
VTGTIIASNGFDPARDGFSFQNYGFIAGTELDQHAMRELFGDQVCATSPSDSCTLTPAAQQWAQQVAEAMVGGHCYGFSMTALRFFIHNLSPSQFGGTSVYSLSLSPSLQSEIAEGWASQVVPAVQHATLFGQPSAVVAFLAKSMSSHSPQEYTLGMYSGPAGSGNREGHAVTPTGIANLGGGRYAILIYDNNKPGTTQAVFVDTNSETWSYQVAINPSQPNAVWSGQGTSNELDAVPVSAILQSHPCPFCSGQGTIGTDTISLGGNPVQHAHLLITTSDGRRLGYIGNRFVNEIRGARVINPALNEIWKASPEPIYLVPSSDRLALTLQGGNPTGTDAAQVHITGPGFGATVAKLVPSSSSHAEINVGEGGSHLSVRLVGTTPRQSPTLQLARDQGRRGNVVSVTPSALRAGDELTVGLSPESRQVSVTSSGATLPVSMTLSSVGPQGTKTIQNGSVGVTAGQQTTLTLGLIKIG